MKRTISSLIGLILFVAVIVVIAMGTANSSSTDSQEQWEYLVVAGGTTNLTSTPNLSLRKEATGAFSREAFPLELNLDKLGSKGWELVTVAGNPADPIYYFKRRK